MIETLILTSFAKWILKFKQVSELRASQFTICNEYNAFTLERINLQKYTLINGKYNMDVTCTNSNIHNVNYIPSYLLLADFRFHDFFR